MATIVKPNSWQNWSGNVSSQPRSIESPASEQALIEIVAQADYRAFTSTASSLYGDGVSDNR